MQAIISAVHRQQHSLDAVESAQHQALPRQPVQLDLKLHDRDKSNRLLLGSIYLSNPPYLFFSMWRLVIFTVTIFSTMILFDMIADVYTNVPGVISVLIFWFIMILAFYSRERLEKIIECLTCKGGCKKKEDLETDRSSIIEMNKSDALRRSLMWRLYTKVLLYYFILYTSLIKNNNNYNNIDKNIDNNIDNNKKRLVGWQVARESPL